MPGYHGKNLRKGRHSEPGHHYVLTSVTHGRQKVFTDWRIGRLLVHEFMLADDDQAVESLAWVIMPDHFHWLISLKNGPLSSMMKKVKSRSAISVNKQQDRNGRAIWQKGYHDHALRKEEDIVAIARYIVANPLRAGLVKKLGDYPLWDAVWV
ncbi:transposase [Thermodesulfobacteriota bacterium]